MKHRIILCGTGTAVGKTHVGEALVGSLAARGEAVVGLKPVESGVGSEETDAERLAAAGMFHVKQPLYAFARPVSPHLAAREAGVIIDCDEIRAWVDHHDAHWQVIETAGGLLSPLGPNVTNVDLLRSLHPTSVVLVAVDRLGVLHDVSAAQLALRTLAPLNWPCQLALCDPQHPDASTGTNARELASLGIAEQVHCFPRLAAAHPETRRVVAGLLIGLVGSGAPASRGA